MPDKPCGGAKPELAAWPVRLWDLLRYFTILTCCLVGVLMASEAAGRRVGGWHATALMSIVMVGACRFFWHPRHQGIDWWPDFGFHAAIPVPALWSLGPETAEPGCARSGWRGRSLLYALVRGGLEGRYPYFFLDLGQFCAVQIALTLSVWSFFSAAGLLLARGPSMLPNSAV